MRFFAYGIDSEMDGQPAWWRTVSIIIGAFLITTLLVVTGCSDRDDADLPANKAATPAASPTATLEPSKGLIKADPNPVPAGPGLGKVKISWSTGVDIMPVAITVTSKGEPEVPFAGGEKTGATEAPWIQAGVDYDFRLYVGTGPTKKLLDHITVTRNK